uniref:hypothetical protein n=1 Tax=Klebsiella pneumoniae TaxID=573 RepID=UPI001952DE14
MTTGKHGLTRRQAMAAVGAAALMTMPAMRSALAAKPTLGEDGLYHMDWYLESFLDIAEDLAQTTERGKRFAIM